MINVQPCQLSCNQKVCWYSKAHMQLNAWPSHYKDSTHIVTNVIKAH